MNFVVSIVSPPNYTHSQAFQEVAETVHYGLLALGQESVLTTTPGSYPDGQHIVFGCNLLASYPIILPPQAILYNLEQISPNSPWLQPELLGIFRQYPLWEYSKKNIEQFAHLGLTEVQYVPIGYVPQLTRIPQLDEGDKDIDVLFYGSLNERRLHILNALHKQGIKIESAFGVYGAARDQLIARAKIVLNIHFYDAKVFEIVRVSYLLANQQFVISERGSDVEAEAEFVEGIVFANYEDLVKNCLDFLERPQDRRQIAATGFDLMSNRPESIYLEAAIQSLNQSQNTLNLDKQAEIVRVDLGCGTRKYPGFIGVDNYPGPNVDIIADLNQNFPFEDSCVDEVRAYDIIEHLPDRIHTMNEIWRICKPGAKVDIFVPSTDGRGAFQDPTHVSYWNINSFQYYCVDSPEYLKLCKRYGFQGAFSIVELEHYESPDQVIHVRAILEAVKLSEDLVTTNAIEELNLREINLIIFPDWSYPEDAVIGDLEEVIRTVSMHPENEKITLLIDISNFPITSEISPELILSYVTINLLLNENVDSSENGPQVSFVQSFNKSQWQLLLKMVRYKVTLPHEDIRAINELGIQDKTSSCTLNDLKTLRTLAFNKASRNSFWLANKVQDNRVAIGAYTYADGPVNLVLVNPEERIFIGKFCSLALGVTIFGGGEHFTNRVTTYPLKFLLTDDIPASRNVDATTKGQTSIGNDVWLGHEAVVLSGVTIGDGAIIGARSVVTKNVPDYAVVAGNPAKVIRYRFEQEVIEYLLSLQWWNWDIQKILANLETLYQNPSEWRSKFESKNSL